MSQEIIPVLMNYKSSLRILVKCNRCNEWGYMRSSGRNEIRIVHKTSWGCRYGSCSIGYDLYNGFRKEIRRNERKYRLLSKGVKNDKTERKFRL